MNDRDLRFTQALQAPCGEMLMKTQGLEGLR